MVASRRGARNIAAWSWWSALCSPHVESHGVYVDREHLGWLGLLVALLRGHGGQGPFPWPPVENAVFVPPREHVLYAFQGPLSLPVAGSPQARATEV